MTIADRRKWMRVYVYSCYTIFYRWPVINSEGCKWLHFVITSLMEYKTDRRDRQCPHKNKNMRFKETADRQNDRQNDRITSTRRLTIMVAKTERSRTNKGKYYYDCMDSQREIIHSLSCNHHNHSL